MQFMTAIMWFACAGAGATSPTSGIAAAAAGKPVRAMSGVGSAALAVSMDDAEDMQDGEEIHFETDQHTPIFQVLTLSQQSFLGHARQRRSGVHARSILLITRNAYWHFEKIVISVSTKGSETVR